MFSELLTLLPELLELLLFGTGAVVLSVAGFYIERFALATMQGGQPKLAAWFGFVGLVTFGFAYLLATDKFHPKLRRVRRRLAGDLD